MRTTRLLVLAAAGALVIGLVMSRQINAAPPKGKQAPAFSGESLDGKKITLADYKGKSAVLLNFFASWCGPCRSEYPHLKALDEEYGKRGIQVVSISLDDSRENAGKLAKDHGARFPVVHDAGGKVARQYGVTSIPLNVIIDDQGAVVQKILGADTGAIRAAVEKLAKPKP